MNTAPSSHLSSIRRLPVVILTSLFSNPLSVSCSALSYYSKRQLLPQPPGTWTRSAYTKRNEIGQNPTFLITAATNAYRRARIGPNLMTRSRIQLQNKNAIANCRRSQRRRPRARGERVRPGRVDDYRTFELCRGSSTARCDHGAPGGRKGKAGAQPCRARASSASTSR